MTLVIALLFPLANILALVFGLWLLGHFEDGQRRYTEQNGGDDG